MTFTQLLNDIANDPAVQNHIAHWIHEWNHGDRRGCIHHQIVNDFEAVITWTGGDMVAIDEESYKYLYALREDGGLGFDFCTLLVFHDDGDLCYLLLRHDDETQHHPTE